MARLFIPTLGLDQRGGDGGMPITLGDVSAGVDRAGAGEVGTENGDLRL